MAALQINAGSSCVIQDAAALRQQLLAALGQAEPVQLDVSGVERIDTAGMQLFVAFALDCLEKGVAFGWSARSAAFDDAASMLGVNALLESPGASSFSLGS